MSTCGDVEFIDGNVDGEIANVLVQRPEDDAAERLPIIRGERRLERQVQNSHYVRESDREPTATE